MICLRIEIAARPSVPVRTHQQDRNKKPSSSRIRPGEGILLAVPGLVPAERKGQVLALAQAFFTFEILFFVNFAACVAFIKNTHGTRFRSVDISGCSGCSKMIRPTTIARQTIDPIIIGQMCPPCILFQQLRQNPLSLNRSRQMPRLKYLIIGIFKIVNMLIIS